MIDLFETFKKIRKSITRWDVLTSIALAVVFFATRIINLTKLPIFTDEAIYIHWARLAWKDASWRFVSLTDGRQPLQTWGTIPFLKFFSDPLFAGRMFGVASGLFAVVGMFLLLRYLFGKKYALIGTFVYIVCPYYLFYERMALVDAAVNGFFIWTLLFSLLQIKYQRLDLALIFGLIAGIGTLSKSTMRIFFIFPLFAPLILYLGEKNYVKKVINYYFLFMITAVMAFAIYNIQRLSPFMHYIEQKNLAFTKPISEFIKNPFDPLLHNLRIIPYYSFSESAYVLPVFGLVGLILMLIKDQASPLSVGGKVTAFLNFLLKKLRIPSANDEISNHRPVLLALYLYCALLIPFAAIACFGNVIFPRYLMFLSIPLLIGFVYLLKTTRSFLIFGFYIISIVFIDYCVIFAPAQIPFPPIDRGQYIEGNAAGYGMNEITNFISKKSAEKDVYVFTEGTFGLLPYALDIHFDYLNPRVHFEPRWPLHPEDFTYAQNLAKDNYVYFVFSERLLFPQEWKLQLIDRFPRPGGKSIVYLFGLQK